MRPLNRDVFGIIGQIQGDGSIESGDSACWQGHWFYLNGGVDPETGRTASEFIRLFEVMPGAYVRHPVPNQTYNGFGAYYAGPYDGVISRDQYHGVLAGIISSGDSNALWRAFKHHGYWLWLFTYNTRVNGEKPETAPWKWPDLTLFDIWAIYIRGFNAWYLYPALLVADLQLLFASVAIKLEPVEKDDVINHTFKLILARERLTTPWSWLATRVLGREHLKAKLNKYWCEWRDNCAFVPLYLKRLFD